MMIVDAIRSASNPHAVHFLVTAYLESLRHFDRTCGVPAEAFHLPIGGSHDLEMRLDRLHEHAVPLEAIVAVAELVAVFACALERLAALSEPAAAGVMSLARSDNPRSALSV
jgi:hypothetical protein